MLVVLLLAVLVCGERQFCKARQDITRQQLKVTSRLAELKLFSSGPDSNNVKKPTLSLERQPSPDKFPLALHATKNSETNITAIATPSPCDKAGPDVSKKSSHSAGEKHCPADTPPKDKAKGRKTVKT